MARASADLSLREYTGRVRIVQGISFGSYPRRQACESQSVESRSWGGGKT